MLTTTNIRSDLKEIRYYFSRKEVFEENSDFVGKNEIMQKIKMYNEAICSATPRLYDLYVSLYLQDRTQEEFSCEIGYALETVSRLNSQLIKHFQKVFNQAA